MNDKKNMFELIEGFPDKQETKESIISDAKILASKIHKENQRTPKQKRTIYFRALASSVTVCIVFLAVFLPTFFHFNQKAESIYYSAEMVYSEKIENINEFVVNNNYDVKYLVGNMGGDSNVASYLVENNKFAFLHQQILFIGEEGFDTLSLGIVPSDDQFDMFKNFNQLDKKHVIADLSIDYKEVVESERINIYSKFKVNNVNYYLKIATAYANGKMDSYIKLLLSDS